jgi:hypothetical protein
MPVGRIGIAYSFAVLYAIPDGFEGPLCSSWLAWEQRGQHLHRKNITGEKYFLLITAYEISQCRKFANAVNCRTP